MLDPLSLMKHEWIREHEEHREFHLVEYAGAIVLYRTRIKAHLFQFFQHSPIRPRTSPMPWTCR